MVDTPPLSENTLKRGLAERRAQFFSREVVERLNDRERAQAVFLVQDVFTSYYESEVALATYDVLSRMGKRVIVLPFRENGKGLHIKGFLRRFRKVAARNADLLREASGTGIPLLGIEPAVTLTYRDEYPKELAERWGGVRVLLLQEYLVDHLPELRAALPASVSGGVFRFFGHCQERTAEPASGQQWRAVFAALGADLTLENLGCCGMCGVFGHEREHLEESRGVFAMSWERRLPNAAAHRAQVLVSGHSCRSQVKRFAGFEPSHPAEVLARWTAGVRTTISDP